MKLQDIIDIFAGGPGSGCHGDNCGRPSGGAERHNPKVGDWFRLKQKMTVRFYKTKKSGRLGLSRKTFNAKTKVKYLGRSTQTGAMQIQFRNGMKWEVYDDQVEPAKITQKEQARQKRLGKLAEPVNEPTYKAPKYEQEKPEPGRPRGSRDVEPTRKKLPMDRTSFLKGKFHPMVLPSKTGLAVDIKQFDLKKMGVSTKMSSVYDGYVAHGQGAGVSVFVERDPKTLRGRVIEVTRGAFEHTGTARVRSFKNLGTMAGFLNKRYGIRMPLPRKGK